jgi:hypothetical protein
MTETTGGPAFPIAQDSPKQYIEYGMTLRDYIAIHAREDDIRQYQGWGAPTSPKYSRVEARYLYADAMIVERSKP